MSLIEDLCVSFATAGFKRIIFLNGHYDNTYAIAYACANAADKIAKDVKAFPVNYWDALTAEEVAEFSTLKTGLHANLAETSAVLRINPDLVDMDKANAEFPPFPDYGKTPTGPRPHRVLLHGPRLGLLGHEVGHLGRRPRLHAGDRRALPPGRRPLDAAGPREYREDLQGDATEVDRTAARGGTGMGEPLRDVSIDDPDDDRGAVRMGFLEHLDELRTRIHSLVHRDRRRHGGRVPLRRPPLRLHPRAESRRFTGRRVAHLHASR